MRTLVRDNALYALMTKHLNNHYLSIHLSQGKVNPREIILHILYCVMPCVTIFLRSTMYCKQETGSSLTPG